MKNKATLGFGILSWKSHKTLITTLESYKSAGLTSFFDKSIIWFNERTIADDKLAKKYGYIAFGDDRNLAFMAEENIAESLNTDYVVVVQNDNILVEMDKKIIAQQLQNAQKLLENGTCDIVRLRHRYQVGESFSDVKKYLKYHNISKISKHFLLEQHPIKKEDLKYNPLKSLKRLLRPTKTNRLIGRSVFIEDNASLLYPNHIKKINNTFIVNSSQINYSEQPFMVKRDFFLNVICKYIREHPKERTMAGHQVPEIILNSKWWNEKCFQIAIPVGLFTHGRIDGRRDYSAQFVDIKKGK